MKGATLLGTVLALAFQAPGARILPAFHEGAFSSGMRFSRSPATEIPLASVEDSLYLINITLGGQPFTCDIDTGSSDLWVVPADSQSLHILNETQVFVNLTYGDKSGIAGFVHFAELVFGGYTIPSQAFILPNSTTDIDQLLAGPDSGMSCLIGLSFDALSDVNLGIMQAFHSTIGQTPLANIFSQNPGLPNNLDIKLQRTIDLEHTDKGVLLIGEHPTEYDVVAKQPIVPTIPGAEWIVEIDAVYVNGYPLRIGKSAVSSLQNSGKLAGLLDSGTTTLELPGGMVEELFNKIPGSFLGDEGQESVIDCLTSVNMSIVIAGIEYHIHPLDLTDVAQRVLPINGKDENVTLCRGRIDSLGDGGGSEFDMILGDVFFRNVLASFNFANWTQALGSGNIANNGSFVQLLPLTNQSEAWSEFLTTRAANLKSLPRVLSAAEFRVLVSEDSTDYTDPSNSTSLTNATHAPAKPPSESLIASGGVAKLASTSDESAGENSQLVSLVHKYGPVLVGLLAGNVFIGVILVAVVVTACLRRQGVKSRNISPSYAPVRFKEADSGVDGTYQD